MLWASTAHVLLTALTLDAVFGEPRWLYAHVPHPVALFGMVIDHCDVHFNRETLSGPSRRLLGVLVVAFLAVGGLFIGLLLHAALVLLPGGWIVEAVLASTLIAQRSLYEHVAAVVSGLREGGLVAGREAVAQIVGRDPDSLDAAGVARAAIESAAENLSDGVVAPVFWFVALGLPGLLLYKLINTADSMIGHRNDRYKDFGWAAARCDDLLNLIPARLTAVLLTLAAALTGRSWRQVWHITRRDAPRHRSPNAGWPEAAMGGALGLALAGPRRYNGMLVDDPWMGGGGRLIATPEDIAAALRLLVMVCAMMWVAALAVVTLR